MCFSDKRLENRFVSFEAGIVRSCSVILRQIANNWNEEIAYGRFLKNRKVTASKILESAYTRTVEAVADRHILLIQDTSTLGFGLNPKVKQLGPIGDNTNGRGFYLHPVIALDASQGTCLGLAGAQMYQRKEYEDSDPMSDRLYRKRQRRKTPFEEKQSYRWLSEAHQASKRTDKANGQTVIADSESDIYDLMVALGDLGIDFILRSFQNRILNKPRSEDRLIAYMEEQPVQGTYEIDLPRTDKRTAHRATLHVKWSNKVKLARPKDTPNKELPLNFETTVIEVKESPDSVVNSEKPVHWRLITSHPVNHFEDALQVIKWYTWRWVIEQLFRSLKLKGLDIQSALVESEHSLYNLAAMALISAIQIMQLVQARDGQNDLSMEIAFTAAEQQTIQQINPSVEGRTNKLRNPHPPGSMAFAAWVIARLGGWSGYASQRPPGPITMANGIRRLRDFHYITQLKHKSNL